MDVVFHAAAFRAILCCKCQFRVVVPVQYLPDQVSDATFVALDEWCQREIAASHSHQLAVNDAVM